MLTLLQNSILGQLDAAHITLQDCLRKSGPENWTFPIGRYQLGRVVFHTLFYTDYYLSTSEEEFYAQPFHQQNSGIFQQYAEMKDVEPGPAPDRSAVSEYLDFCRSKARETVLSQTEQTFQLDHHAPWLQLTRAEVYIYNARHVQHHAAQIQLRLRQEHQIDIPWVKAGRLEELD